MNSAGRLKIVLVFGVLEGIKIFYYYFELYLVTNTERDKPFYIIKVLFRERLQINTIMHTSDIHIHIVN